MRRARLPLPPMHNRCCASPLHSDTNSLECCVAVFTHQLRSFLQNRKKFSASRDAAVAWSVPHTAAIRAVASLVRSAKCEPVSDSLIMRWGSAVAICSSNPRCRELTALSAETYIENDTYTLGCRRWTCPMLSGLWVQLCSTISGQCAGPTLCIATCIYIVEQRQRVPSCADAVHANTA